MLSANELKRYDYFSGLSESALNELSTRLEIVHLPAGTKIIRQFSPPDYFYFIKKGAVEVTKRNQFGQNSKLSVLSTGEGFGEIAMLTCSNRTCSVTAKTDVALFRLSRRDFEETVIKDSSFKDLLQRKNDRYTSYNKIKTFRPFALIEPQKMLALSDKFIERTFATGEEIINQGEKGDFYYVIESGKAEVIKHNKDGSTEQLALIGEGEGFGEEAIIRDQGRNATVRAVEDTTVLAIDKKDFDIILRASFLDFTFPEDISEEERGIYVFIDARITKEYEEEHIEGAINIPLESLRLKYQELDPAQEYLTYCTNDSRGMTAAFLLRMNGFKAMNLRGGLSGWTGPVTTLSDGIHLPITRDK